jgi:membrane protein DedA with SNARE-associated domain
MPQLAELLQVHGVLIVFGIVLVEQFGPPIPAFPILVVAGALSVDGSLRWEPCLLSAVAACLLCKMSLSPDSCVSQTEDRFRRFGAKSPLVSKFVPGFKPIAAPLSGATGIHTRQFVGYSATGAATAPAAPCRASRSPN